MAAKQIQIARQRLAISRSAAGVPRTYRIVRPRLLDRRLGEVASSLGGALNSALVVLGDRFRP
jgi:hypothetical protein